jgi:hypothetical protein
MKKFISKFSKWFDLNLGWFFINGFKRDEWQEYLERKYKQPHKK